MTENTCMITGGSGFIGNHLTTYFLSNSDYDKICVLDLKPPIFHDKRLIYKECDIRKPINVDIELSNCDCYHLAGHSREPKYLWEDYFYTNYIGTQNVCEFAKRRDIKNILFTSTMMIFRAGEERMSEMSITAPDTAYGISKLLAEWVLLSWKSSSPDHRLRIIRPGVVFGKGENGNFTRLYYSLKKGLFFYVGRQNTVKSCVYVKDLINFLVFLADDRFKNTIYNVAYPSPTTIQTICDSFFEVFEFKRKVFTIPYKLALACAYLLEWFNKLGILKGNIHHRHIQKLYFSTNIAPDNMSSIGFNFNYSLLEALKDWKKDCAPNDLY